MKKNDIICRIAAIVVMLSCMTALPPSADAQFLKKLSQGLEKVNKTLQKVEDATKNNKKQSDKKPSPQTVQTSQSSQSSQNSQNSQNPAPTKKKERRIATAHLTPQTKFINGFENLNNLPPVSEGIFYLMRTNSGLSTYTRYYGFWTIDGRLLFPYQYEQMPGDASIRPRFNSGACVMKEAKAKVKNAPIILYADGTTKPLSHDWTDVTQFCEGVAQVCEQISTGGQRYFYINTKAQKIWPHLDETVTTEDMLKTRKIGGVHIRSLREGRRAFFDRTTRTWGYLDTNGKIVIKPAYAEVRDFANGYALVELKEKGTYESKKLFIDKSGNVVTSVINGDVHYLKDNAISDVSDGIFSTTRNNALNNFETIYYDITSGKELRRYKWGGSAFHEGYAFVRFGEMDETVYVIDTSFNIVGRINAKCDQLVLDNVSFRNFPWYTFDNKAVNYEGTIELALPKKWDLSDKLGEFSADGFAPAQSTFASHDGSGKSFEYSGYIDTDGAYRIVFSSDNGANGPFDRELPGPEPIKPPKEPEDSTGGGYIKDPIPPQPGQPRDGRLWLSYADTIPEGPIGPGREALKYRVNVVAYPAKGGKVYGSGEYSLGDTIRVTGTPAEGYHISEIVSDRMCSSTETFNKFVVLGDMTITCYFVKDDVVGDVPSTAMIGHMPTQPQFCRAYVELGNVDGNKFTEGSRGVAAIFVTDDNRSEIDASDKQATTSCRAKAFFVPMNILGIMDDNGRKYLRFDGGIIKYTLSVSDDTALGFLSNPLLKLMLAFDGRDRGELEPGAYRIEIVEGSPEDGEMTLGELQRLSARYGWINSDDESFTKRLPAFFGPKYSKGLSSDFFAGTRLSTTKPTAIQWEPSEDFFADRSLLEQLAASLGELYRKAVKGTRLEDYDMQQFSTDLDNHVFKAK